MTNAPTSHKIARIVVILVLLGVFALLVVLHANRFSGRMYVVEEDYAWHVPGASLPGFEVEPLDNHTRFTSFECASGDSTDISPYAIRNHAVPYSREDLAKAWPKYQELKAKNPGASTDELLNQMDAQESFGVSSSLDSALRNDTQFQEDLKAQRWNTYTLDSGNRNTSDNQPVAPVTRKGITCRIGGFQEISVENATVTTPTVVREVSTNGTAMPVATMDPFVFSMLGARNVPLVTNQQLVFTYTPVLNCWEDYSCPFCSRSVHCYTEYKLSSKDALPVANGALLPTPFQNASSPASMANYAYLTIRLDTPVYYREVQGLRRTRVRIYGFLDALTALFATICFLLLVYTLLMGDFKLNPFGWVQRFVLFSSRKAYVEQVKAEAAKEEQALETVLFGLYLNGNQLENRKAV